MGRKPNPLILEYFERGPKLSDHSNRYPHTCKQCGESFPKGRIDSLTAHITKKCPAISESERMRACLALHGIVHARSAAERHQQALAHEDGPAAPASSLPQGWSALETLAEVSRQVDLNENSRAAAKDHDAPGTTANGPPSGDRFELHEQYTLENPPLSYGDRTRGYSRTEDGDAAQVDCVPAPVQTPPPPAELSPEERLQALLPASESSPDLSNISVAVAAAARLHSSFLDPLLVNHDPPSTSSPVADAQTAAEAVHDTSEPAAQPAVAETNVSQPWGEMTYLTTASPVPMMVHKSPPVPVLSRGGVRMDVTGSVYNGRSRHFRSKFTAARRLEVKEVRKLGACIRCRILRKICSKGTPCDTCRKVLAPRIWMTGCVRTRLHEQLDLYAAGVQVVLSQNRINLHKDQLQLTDVDSLVEVSHFPDTGKHISLATLAVLLQSGQDQDEAAQSKDYQVIMINQDKEDVPAKVEAYMRDVLQLFIEREPSKFMRVTLDMAMKQLAGEEDDLLRKALELWGLVECIDRERQWSIVEKPPEEGQEPRPIKEAQDGNDVDIYTMICMQLNAAAERKANGTSMSLLNLMDRLLADSKTKAGFRIYLTALIFLNCVEKSTWAFKAWEQDHLRPGWPLERDPSVFTQQGTNLASLLRMLMSIRKALPQTVRREDGKLAALDQDPTIVDYFQRLDMDYDTIQARQKGSQFSPADSRSLELTFCSHLLLPNTTTA